MAPAVSMRVGGLALSWDQCAACRLVFQNPPLSDASLRRLYSETNYFAGSAYHNYTQDDDLRLAQGRERLERIERLSRLRGGRLLDVGSASCFFGAVARDRGYAVTCIEPDETLAAHGRTRYGLDVRATTFDACDLEEHAYDLVTLWGADSHFEHPLESFSRLRRLLRPGGFLAMTYQDFDHPIRWLLPGIKVSWNAIFNFTDRSFGVMMDRAGFTVVHRLQTEWQRSTLGHICRVARLPAPWGVNQIRVRVPAVSFRWILAQA